MKKYIFLMLVLISVKQDICAQEDSLKYKYINQTIYRYGRSFMKGTERLTFPELRNEFTMSELGLASYDQSKKYKNISNVFSVASLAASITTLVIVSNNGKRSTLNLLLIGQILLGAGAGGYRMLSAKSLDRALWQRNKDVLFPPK